jgi:hypothetical protein
MAGLTKEREAKLKEAREGIESIQKWVKAILDVIDLTPDEDGAS